MAQMKPYYEHNGITIYHGDCRDVLPRLEPESVDLVLTDPPYGVSHKSKGEPYMAGDHMNLAPVVMQDLYRLLNPKGAVYIFGATLRLRELLFAFESYFKMHGILIWDKKYPIYPHSPAHYLMQYEPIVYGSRGLHHLRKERPSDIIQVPIVRGRARRHPTQKPLGLCKMLLKSSQSNHGMILDPFLGSGTTLCAAKDLGRRAIGIEIEEKYCEIAAQRLAQEVML